VSKHSRRFPRLTWVSCECGCGYEGEDLVAQYLIEEALFELLDGVKLAVAQEEHQRSEYDLALEDAHRKVQEELGGVR